MLCVVLRRGKEKERERKVRGGQNQGKVERVKRKGGWGGVGGWGCHDERHKKCRFLVSFNDGLED